MICCSLFSMDQFAELRKLAREKRDAAIQAARDEYHEQLQEIAVLEKSLKPRKPSLKGQAKPKVPMRVKIMEVCPKDRPFSLAELVELLGLPERESVRVRTTLDRLKKRGEIEQVRRGKGKCVALWAITGVCNTNPLNQLSMKAAAAIVLKRLDTPGPSELAVAMLEQGYAPSTGSRSFQKSILKIHRDLQPEPPSMPESSPQA